MIEKAFFQGFLRDIARGLSYIINRSWRACCFWGTWQGLMLEPRAIETTSDQNGTTACLPPRSSIVDQASDCDRAYRLPVKRIPHSHSIHDTKSPPLENGRDDRRRIDAFSYEDGRRLEFGDRS